MADIAVRTEGLTRDFKSTRAVDHLSTEVRAGTIFGFLGPNGSGKTTTIRMLLGLLEPTSGRAEVMGFDTRKAADQIRLNCGALLEHDGLYDRLTAEENLNIFGRIWNLSARERSARIQELLQPFGLWERRHERAGSWSRGMRQKLAIARAMMHRPAVLFLDEPTSGLDAVAAASLCDTLADLARKHGATIFLTTHNLAEAQKLCDEVAVIREGKLLAVGSPGELSARCGRKWAEIRGQGFTSSVVETVSARAEVRSATLKNNRMTVEFWERVELPAIIQQLVEAGVQIEDVRKGEASLEEVFLALVKENR